MSKNITSVNDITGDNIKSKASTEAYREGYDKIFKKNNKCICSFRYRVLGDGCHICNPTLMDELLKDENDI